MTTVISACSVTAHVTVALAAVTRRPEAVRVDAQMAGRVTTVRQVGFMSHAITLHGLPHL